MRLLAALALTLAAGSAMAQPTSIPPEVIAAARRTVVMTVPGMDRVAVTKNLPYAGGSDPRIAMDVYRPEGLKPGERRGAVIFIHGGGPPGAPMKEIGAFTSYGRLAAAQGLVGVTFTHRLGFPQGVAEGATDVAAAVAYVRAHAADLNVDPDRICLAAYSAGGAMLAPYVKDAPSWLRCLVAFYPMMDLEGSAQHRASNGAETLAAQSPLRQVAEPGRKAPLYLARAGADEIPELLPGVDRFVAEALRRDYPLTVANNPGAPHSFDLTAATPRTLEILQETFAFLRRSLGG